MDNKDDAALEAFKTVTTALAELKDEEAQQRVLRASAILIGIEFIENERKVRSR